MKKNISISVVIAALALFASGCSSDILDVESKTAVTSDYLYSSAEGLTKAVVALYDMDRSYIDGETNLFTPIYMDYCTDIQIYQGGVCASLGRLSGNTPSTQYFKTYWQYLYKIVGKSNEVIAAAQELGLDDPIVARSFGEASLFRGRAYFLLYERFERLYLNTVPTTVENAFDRTFRPASKTELFAQIKTDLDNAIEYLDWSAPAGTTGKPEYGRFTKAVAKHVRAQVAMWEDDWDTAIKQCEDIFTDGAAYNYLSASAIANFTGADLNTPENLYVYQFSNLPGGGNTTSGGVVQGHRLSLISTPRYDKMAGMTFSAENGGYGWGRAFPNTYLFSLYDQAKDKRYKELFKMKWYYNNEKTLPKGKKLGDEWDIVKSNYLNYQHPCSLKYFDQWTNSDLPSRTSSFKDVVVYRLAETYLMCSEAYFHRDGGASPKAVEYYNKTYVRAGNDPKTFITLDDLLDEYARECHFEGVRWPLLKRLGLLEERVKLHYGDTKREDPNLNSDYIQCRQNFVTNRDWRWPIPQDELDLMPGFGQNEGW